MSKTSIINDSFIEYASSTIGDTSYGLSGKDIIHYSNKYATLFDISIPITSSNFGDFGSIVPNKKTALSRNLTSFNDEQKYVIILDLCNLKKLSKREEILELKTQLIEKYNHLNPNSIQHSELIKKTKDNIENNDESYHLYIDAIDKFSKNLNDRNILDDMRLSLEILLKDILNNKKSLENQFSPLGIFLKENGISKEVRNIFGTVLEYYTKYHNNNVKHDNNINSFEVKYKIEQTSVMINMIIDVKNQKNL